MSDDPSIIATLQRELVDTQVPPADAHAADLVRERADNILRPPGALARLDDLAVWLAGWQRTASPTVGTPAILIFAGDHGVVTEGVSAFPADVTASMLAAFEQGVATINALATSVGARVEAIDVGVGKPTANLRVQPAMSPAECQTAFAAGRHAVRTAGRAEDLRLLVVGEMGIGNTTAAAAMTAAFAQGTPTPPPIGSFVGRGTGVGDAALKHKMRVVSAAVDRTTSASGATGVSPMEVLRQLGGREIAAMTGAMFEARVQSIPMVLDGYIATAAALVLHQSDPALTDNMIAGHRSAEPGHQWALAHMGKPPLLQWDFRLGEGSGAAAAIPFLRMACAAVTNVATFPEFFGDPNQ